MVIPKKDDAKCFKQSLHKAEHCGLISIKKGTSRKIIPNEQLISTFLPTTGHDLLILINTSDEQHQTSDSHNKTEEKHQTSETHEVKKEIQKSPHFSIPVPNLEVLEILTSSSSSSFEQTPSKRKREHYFEQQGQSSTMSVILSSSSNNTDGDSSYTE